MCLIQGENQDNPSASSNGSGKSSIVDGICWALYGETARGVPANQVVRHGAKKAVATVIFEDDGGRVFWVSRDRTKTKGTLLFRELEPGTTIDKTELTLGTDKLTQERIEKALGASYEVFRAAVYIGQEAMPDLPAMTDKKLKELIEEAAGVGVIEAAYALARSKLQEQERTEQRESDALTLARSTLSGYSADLAQLHLDYAAWAKRKTAQLEEINRRLTESKVVAARAAVDPELMTPGNLTAAKDRKAELDGQLKGLDAEVAREKALERELNQAQQRLAAANAQARTLAEGAVKAKLAADAVAAREGQPCTSCGQALTAGALKHACDATSAAAAERKTEAQGAVAALAGVKGAVAVAEAALAAFRAGMSDPTALRDEAATLTAAIGRHGLKEIESLSAMREIARIEEELDRAKSEANPIGSMIAAKNAQIEAAEKRVYDTEKALAEAQEETEIQRQVARVFGPAGVRAHILDKVTPFLNDRTAAYLAALSDGTLSATWTTLVKDAKGNLKEKFAVEIIHPAGEGFAGLSGGEKRKVRLACGMALQDLVASRASKPFKLWVVDECDEALDEAGLERLMTVLNEKAKEKGTVLVISHRSLTDWIGQSWTVVKKGGVSTLEGHE